jgi:hypothetical protein
VALSTWWGGVALLQLLSWQLMHAFLHDLADACWSLSIDVYDRLALPWTCSSNCTPVAKWLCSLLQCRFEVTIDLELRCASDI